MAGQVTRQGASFAVVIALGVALHAAPVRSAEPESPIDAFVRTARQINPEAAAMALEADAATARIGSAGALEDPKFKAEVMFPRRMPGYLPSRRAEEELYQVRQMVPLWGKRDLKREIAESDSHRARGHCQLGLDHDWQT